MAILGQKTLLHWHLNKVIPSGMLNCNFEAIRPIIVNSSFIVTRPHRKKSSSKCCMKVDYLITNGEKKIFFPSIVKNTGSRNTLITDQNIIDTR